ncbi:MAG TPA: autotransporter-associated beta strand repeat-containing protein, partial [Stenotrophomonas sp.]
MFWATAAFLLAVGNAQANCTGVDPLTVICDASAPNPFGSTVGSARSTPNFATVIVQPNGAIAAGNANAISLGNNAVIDVQAGATVENNAGPLLGLWATGPNAVEFGSSGTMTIAAGAMVRSNGSANNGEAINVMGIGNVITNYGSIVGRQSAAIWFEDLARGGTNVVDNYGVVQTDLGTNSNVIGNGNGGSVDFTNRSGARVFGSLHFSSGNDTLTLFADSLVTGSFEGGGGNNALTLNGVAGSSDTLAGSIRNFQSLTKTGDGTWTLSGSVGANGGGTPLQVLVQQGTLSLTGTNDQFNGRVTVDPAGTLQARAQSLPQLVVNNGWVNFVQDTAGTYAGLIQGSGSVRKQLGGTLTLSGANSYAGGTLIDAGTLWISSDANLGAASGALAISGNGVLGVTRDVATTRATTLGAPGGAFNVATGVTLDHNGVVSGPGSLGKIGNGVLALNAANSYAGDTWLDAGTIRIGADAALGNGAGVLRMDGGILNTIASFASARAGELAAGGGTFQVTTGTTLGWSGAISGTGGLTKTDAGTLDLSAANSYAGGTAINGGAIRIASDANLGASTGGLSFDSGTLVTTAGMTIGRAVTINAGGARFDTATADPAVDTQWLHLSGTLGGSGGLTKLGGGTLHLQGNNSYTGDTLVGQGWLFIDGDQSAATGTTTLQAGTRLAGDGIVGGDVVLQSGAYLTPGSPQFTPASLTINGDLELQAGSALYYNLVEANVAGGAFNDLLQVNGDLTLGGSFYVVGQGQLAPGETFGPGVYRIINYSGQLLNPTGLALGGLMPPGAIAPDPATQERALAEFFVQTAVDGQVNLVNSTGLTLSFWDGGDNVPGQKDNNAIEGGNGTWWAPGLDSTNNWTNDAGGINAPWANGAGPTYGDAAFAIFGGVAGTVSVDNAQPGCSGTCQVNALGMQFVTGGYTIQGDPLNLVANANGQSVIRVGDGSAGSAAMVATLDAVLGGSTVLAKTDGGTLVLGGTNTYTGGTRIKGGVLQISSDANLGAAGTGLAFETGTLHTTASLLNARAVTLDLSSASGTGVGTFDTDGGTTLQLDGVVGGAGALAKQGAGTLILSNNNTYTGGTTVAAGTLQIGNGGNSGAVVGDVLNHGLLVFDRADDFTWAGMASGTGALRKAGSNALTLTGDSTYTGGTTIAGGSLILGDGGTSGSLVGNVVDDGSLVFNRTGLSTFSGLISGTGSLGQTAAGITVLTGANSYAGATTVDAGWLYINGDQSASTGDATFASQTRLGGNGIVGGNVTLADGAVLAPGVLPLQPATLTINGDLVLGNTSKLYYNLEQANIAGGPRNDLTIVRGGLTLDGFINVIETGQDLGPGVYRIFEYDGALTDNGL